MSLICGVVSLHDQVRVEHAWKQHLRDHISRRRHGVVHEFDTDSAFVLKLDLGAFGDCGWLREGDGVACISGDAILGGGPTRSSRTEELKTLLTATRPNQARILKSSRGNFGVAIFDSRAQQLLLATDRLGVRPLYYLCTGPFIVFSTVLRLIEGLPGLRLVADFQGVLEEAAFGYSLADRTRYADLRCLRSGEMLRAFANSGVAVERYWRWDHDACGLAEFPKEEGLASLREKFSQAVRLRLEEKSHVVASLSGGLDSRVVVTELRNQQREVHTFNVSWSGSQDFIFGRMYADAIGTKHHAVALEPDKAGRIVYTTLYEAVAAAFPDQSGVAPQRRIWGGSGGSVGLGHVYLSPQIIQAHRESGPSVAARAFLAKNSIAISKRLLRPPHRENCGDIAFKALLSELNACECRDPARAMYVFLLENDQRRHMAPLLEDVDCHPLEFIDPIFDTDVLATACRLPLDYCLEHRMYHDWMKLVSPITATVPWQAYPGHQPCPIPASEEFRSQFAQSSPELASAEIRETLANARQAVKSFDLLTPYISWSHLLMAYLASRLGKRSVSYVFRQAEILRSALAHTEGRIQIGPWN